MSMHEGSYQSRLASLNLGDVIWIESTADGYIGVMRACSTRSRWTAEMKKRQFQCRLYRALGESVLSPVVVLVRVERMQ